MKLLLEVRHQFFQDRRFSCNQQFVDRESQSGYEIRYLYDFHFIDKRFFFGIFVGSNTGQNLVPVISQNIQSRIGGCNFIDRRNHVGRQGTIIDDLSGRALGNPGSVEGEHISAVFGKIQLFCQRNDTVDRASAGKYNFLSFLLNLDECLFCRFCKFFSGIGQSAVQIKNEHLVVHMLPLF